VSRHTDIFHSLHEANWRVKSSYIVTQEKVDLVGHAKIADGFAIRHIIATRMNSRN